RMSLALHARKAIAITTAAAELLSLLPSATGAKKELGPIWKPKTSYSIQVTDGKSNPDKFDPRYYDLSTQNLPPKDNGEVRTPYGDLPIEGLDVVADPASIDVPKNKIMAITTIEPPHNPKDVMR